MDKIRIVVVDDHEIFRNGVIQLINQEEDMVVEGESGDGEEAVKLIKEIKPDVIIMDISMPVVNGLDASKLLLESNKDAKILFFSLYDKEDYIISALEMGAYGYILKDTSNKIFLDAVRSVYRGNYYFIGEVSDVIVRQYHQKRNITKSPDTVRPSSNNKVSLSKRENEILKLIHQGRSNKAIADRFAISVRTIETHRLNIMRKFMLNSIEEVLIAAEKMKIL